MNLVKRVGLGRPIHHAEYDGNNAYLKALTSVLNLPHGMAYKSWGDSVTYEPAGYVPLFAAKLGGPFTNYGVASTRMDHAIGSIFSHQELLPTRDYLASVGNGINDWRQETDEAGMRRFIAYVRLFLESCFAQEYILSNDARFDFSASAQPWEFANGNFPGNYGRTGGSGYMPCTQNGGSVTLSVTSDNCTVVLHAQNQGFIGNSANVYVDGVIQAHIDPRELAGGGGAAPLFLRFPHGTHTIKIESGGSGRLVLDYVSIRRPATENNVPALVFAANNLSDDGRQSGTLSQAYWDARNERTRKAVEQYQRMGYPVRWVDLNVEYDPAMDTYDGIHPGGSLGDKKILFNLLSYVAITA